MVKMFAVDVGDHRQNRRQLEEGAVAFIGLDYEQIALAHARVAAAHGGGSAANDHGGVESGVIENGGGHRGGGGFSMAAGHGDAELQTHQLSQQLAARDYRDAQPPRFNDFGIGSVDRGADHQHARAVDVGGAVALMDGGAERGEAFGDGAEPQVRPADLIAEIQQHLGNSAHADPADAREVQVLPA